MPRQQGRSCIDEPWPQALNEKRRLELYFALGKNVVGKMVLPTKGACAAA